CTTATAAARSSSSACNRTPALLDAPPDRPEQALEPVVVDLMHQGKQAAELARRKTVAGKPVQIMARQVRQHPPLIFAKRHSHRDQFDQHLFVHTPSLQSLPNASVEPNTLQAPLSPLSTSSRMDPFFG